MNNIILLVKDGAIDDLKAPVRECKLFHSLEELNSYLHREYNIEYRRVQWQIWYSSFVMEKEFMWGKSHYIRSFFIEF